MRPIEEEVQQRLLALQDLPYRAFSCKLIPTADPGSIIGVRMPRLRHLAREYTKNTQGTSFLGILPHRYHEENLLHGLLIEPVPVYESALQAVETFLPYIDNWAVCDLTAPVVFASNRHDLLENIQAWLDSDKTYTIRFGIGMLLRHYLDDAFHTDILETVASIHSDEYYVNMMIAWFFATALAKQYAAALPYILDRRLAPWTHNKTIQKALESRRVSAAGKERLRLLKGLAHA